MKERGENQKKRGDKSRGCSDAVADFEDGGKGHEPRKAGGLQGLERAKNRFSPGASRRHLPATVISVHEPQCRLLTSRTVRINVFL